MIFVTLRRKLIVNYYIFWQHYIFFVIITFSYFVATLLHFVAFSHTDFLISFCFLRYSSEISSKEKYFLPTKKLNIKNLEVNIWQNGEKKYYIKSVNEGTLNINGQVQRNYILNTQENDIPTIEYVWFISVFVY